MPLDDRRRLDVDVLRGLKALGPDAAASTQLAALRSRPHDAVLVALRRLAADGFVELEGRGFHGLLPVRARLATSWPRRPRDAALYADLLASTPTPPARPCSTTVAGYYTETYVGDVDEEQDPVPPEPRLGAATKADARWNATENLLRLRGFRALARDLHELPAWHEGAALAAPAAALVDGPAPAGSTTWLLATRDDGPKSAAEVAQLVAYGGPRADVGVRLRTAAGGEVQVLAGGRLRLNLDGRARVATFEDLGTALHGTRLLAVTPEAEQL